MKTLTILLIYATLVVSSLVAVPAFTVDAGHASGRVSTKLYG